MSSATFNPVTTTNISFTNITASETDTSGTGAETRFVGSSAQVTPVSAGTSEGIQWGGFSAGVYYGSGSEVLNISYTASTGSPSTLIDAASGLYTTDLLTGPGVHLTAVENVYGTSGTLLGTQTFTSGATNPGSFTLSQAASAVNVSLTITMSADGTATPASAVLISAIQQSFETAVSSPLSGGGPLSSGGTTQGTGGSIGSTVWLDSNYDGLLNNNEAGVAGVTVELLNSTGTNVLATTTTSASGQYQFNNLNASTYEVKFIAPTGDSFTTQGVGSNPALNSSADQMTGITAPITLSAGQVDNNVEAGLTVPTASIGSTVWLDSNYDGLLNNNEAGVAGVTVELLNSTGTDVLATTTTSASGQYQFNNLNASTYEVKFIAPTGDSFTTQGVGSNPALSSSADQMTGITAPVTLSAGQVDNNVEAGLTVPTASIGSTVWLDSNYDGLLNNNEAGVAGVTVELLNSTGTNVLATTTTSASGQYQFSSLNAGTYEVKFIAPTGDSFTTQGVGSNPALSSSADQTTGITAPITLSAGQVDNNVEAGLTVPTASIGSTVWLDSNHDGLLNSNETGVAGVTVELLNAAGTSILATTTTTAGGLYNFTGLNAGVYEVKFVAPTGTTFTTQGVGTNAAIDSSPNAATGITAPITLTAGQIDNSVQAGLETSNGISVVKLPCSTVVNQCGQVTYTFDVTNTGTSPLTNIKISDNIGTAANPDLVTPTAVLNCAGQNVGDTNHDGILNPGETWQYKETVNQINCNTSSSGSVCHTASGSHLTSGSTAWLSSSFNPTSWADGATYRFQGVSCTVDGHGVGSAPIKIDCPDSVVKFSRSCTSATTVYDSNTNCWTTTLPADRDPGSVFLTGCPTKVPTGADFSNASVTWSVADSSNNCGPSALNWDGSCTGYASFNQNGRNGLTDYNHIGVKSCDNLSGYGNGGSCDVGYGWQGSGYTDTGYNGWGGGCGYTYNQSGWQGSSSDNCGTPENQFTSSNCGDPSARNTTNTYNAYSQNNDGGWGSGWGSYSGSSWGSSGGSSWSSDGGSGWSSDGSSGCNWGQGSNWGSSWNWGQGSGSSQSGSNGSCGASGTLSQNCTPIAGAADTVTVTATTVVAAGHCTSTASGGNLGSGSTAWLSSTFRPTSSADGATYEFKGVHCTISGSGTGASPISIACPDATVTFSSACRTATTVFDAGKNTWITTLPANSDPGNVFITGCPTTVPSGRDLSGATVSWSIDSSANNCGSASLNWQGSCTGYQSFNINGCNGTRDYNQIGVKACDKLSGYGNGGSTSVGYGWDGSGYSDYGYSSGGGGCGWGGWYWGGYNTHGWDGGGSNAAATPENEYTNNNCGQTSACTSHAADMATCSSTSTGTSTSGSGGTAVTVTASDTKEVQVLGCNSNVSVDGTVPTGSLSALYGTAQTMEFLYSPGNTVTPVQAQSGLGTVAGTNAAQTAYMVIGNASGSSIYFEGAVITGEKIYADAATNVLTNTPISGGHFDTTPGADIVAKIYASQQAFQIGAAAAQTIGYNASGSQAMHIGDTIGSLQLVGYVGATGGHLSS